MCYLMYVFLDIHGENGSLLGTRNSRGCASPWGLRAVLGTLSLAISFSQQKRKGLIVFLFGEDVERGGTCTNGH